MRTALALTVSIASAAALAACASAPVSLVALPPAPAPANVSSAPGPTLLIRPLSLPGYLDNFPVVLGRQGGTLVTAPGTEWAERLPAAVTRVLRDALARRLDPSRVLVPGDGRRADSSLTIEFIALDPVQGHLHLDARWTFACAQPSAPANAGRTEFDVPLAGSTAAAVSAATSEALGRLADALVKEDTCPQGSGAISGGAAGAR